MKRRQNKKGGATPHLLAIVGRSNAGKTTLIEALIPKLRHRGLQVATIKHCHHALPLDTPGKDSWRHRKAGAEATLLISPDSLMLTGALQNTDSPTALAARHLVGYDLALVEGYSALPGPKIEVVRQERSATLLSASDAELLAVVTDVPTLTCDAKIFRLDESVDPLVDLILDWLP